MYFALRRSKDEIFTYLKKKVPKQNYTPITEKDPDRNKARQEENYMARQTLFPNMDSRLWLVQIRNVGVVNLSGKKRETY